LGEEMGLRYRHAELKALVSLQHHKSHSHEGNHILEGGHGGLTDDEVYHSKNGNNDRIIRDNTKIYR